MGRPTRQLTDAELRRMKEAVEGGVRLDVVARRFSIGSHVPKRMAEKHGWRIPYSDRTKPKSVSGNPPRRKGRKVGVFQTAALAKDNRQLIAKADAKLYGELLPAVNLLRHRGFVVFRDHGGIRVGNDLLDEHALLAKAMREQRLIHPLQP